MRRQKMTIDDYHVEIRGATYATVSPGRKDVNIAPYNPDEKLEDIQHGKLSMPDGAFGMIVSAQETQTVTFRGRKFSRQEKNDSLYIHSKRVYSLERVGYTFGTDCPLYKMMQKKNTHYVFRMAHDNRKRKKTLYAHLSAIDHIVMLHGEDGAYKISQKIDLTAQKGNTAQTFLVNVDETLTVRHRQPKILPLHPGADGFEGFQFS